MFDGWHPQCFCYVTPILVDEDLYDDIMNRDDWREQLQKYASAHQIDDCPKNFHSWVADNKERAKGWSSMPYFVRDNSQYVKEFEVDTYTPEERKFTRARSTSAAMDESLGIYLSSRYPEIPNTEKAALFHYTRGDTSAYRSLNKELRKGELSEFNQAFSALLSKALGKIEPVQATVYRTIRLNRTDLLTWVNQANSQAETTFSGFTSTSLDRSVTENMIQAKSRGRKRNESDVLLVIQGKSGHPISDFSQFGGRFTGKPNQREVLFDKGCKFRFDEIKKEEGIYVFYLTEI